MQLWDVSKTIKEPGYVYIYLSNEGNVQQDIYFDDLAITHEKSRVIQNDDYYPFGLTFNSSRRENSVTNAYQYNGKEMQDELGLGMLDYGARMYMCDIGRWGVIDPLAEKSRRWSPYTYVYDNPLRFIDPDGMEGMGINPITGGARGEGNAIEFRKWRDVSDPAKRAEELRNNRTRTPRLGTCSTCPADSKYDQFRESDMPFAYEEGVGVYNDYEIPGTVGSGDVQTGEHLAGFVIPDNEFGYDEGNLAREIIGGGMVASGQPWVPKRFVTKATPTSKAASRGTSIASKTLSKALPQQMPIRVLGTKTLGRALGRFVPYVGWGLLIWDAADLTIKSVESFTSDSPEEFWRKTRQNVTTVGMYNE